MKVLTTKENLKILGNSKLEPKPFLKWAGGKRQLLPVIRKLVPREYGTYYETFLGAAAVLFDLQPSRSIINDTNSELINCYNVIKNLSTDLIEDLKKHQNAKEYFYSIREMDRNGSFGNLSPVERASRIIFLNKTCFNGLFRVNSHGQFNAPFGKYKEPKIVNAEIILAVSQYLNNNDVTILNTDFAQALLDAQRNDFIYLDPPYYPLSDTSSFTGYNPNQFGRSEQIRLCNLFNELTTRGCKVMLSNSASPFIEDLYRDYNIIRLKANRNINSNGNGRKKIDEFLILNYVP
jgi:DNA adenine methylase